MAGSISLSLSQQFDSLGRPLSGGFLYTYAAGTTTPQSAYQDTGLSVPLPNPITLDSAGRLPQMFFADGNIKIRLTDANLVTQVAADNILVIGQSSGGGGGATVDPTTVLQTGWIQPIYGTGVVSGFVRANARTIGSATSGATERANSDTQALFLYLYAADSNLAVSGGRGASAAADYAANKTIALPDYRGRGIAGLDDMGNSAAGRLTATYFGTAATVLGAAGGGESKTLVTANLPPYTPQGTISTPLINIGGASALGVAFGAGATNAGPNAPNNSFYVTTNFNPIVSSTPTFTGTAVSGQISTPLRTVQPTMLATIYLKL